MSILFPITIPFPRYWDSHQVFSRKRLDKFKKEYKKTLRKINADRLHDMRVATRRLRVLLQISELHNPSNEQKRLRKILKNFMKPLGDYRDNLLQEQRFEKYKNKKNSGLYEYYQYLKKESMELKKQTDKIIKTFNFPKTFDSIQTIVNKPVGKQPIKSSIDFGQLIKESLAVIYRLQKKPLTKLNEKSFHKMRIGIKRLRYRLEIVSEILKEIKQKHLAILSKLQTVMGDIHDLDVLSSQLVEFNKFHIKNQEKSNDILKYIKKIQKNRKLLFRKFIKLHNKFEKEFPLK